MYELSHLKKGHHNKTLTLRTIIGIELLPYQLNTPASIYDLDIANRE